MIPPPTFHNSQNLIYFILIVYFCTLVAASEGRTWNADILKNSGQEMSVLRSSLSNNAHQDQIGKNLCCKLYHKFRMNHSE